MSLTPQDPGVNLPASVEDTLDAIPWVPEGEAALKMAAAIVEAPSIEDALTPPEEQIGLRAKWLGIPIQITDVGWMASTLDSNPLGRYALVDFVDSDGQKHTGSVGGLNVCLQLARVAELGGFPVTVKLVQVQSRTNSDRKPLWLQIVGAAPGSDF